MPCILAKKNNIFFGMFYPALLHAALAFFAKKKLCYGIFYMKNMTLSR